MTSRRPPAPVEPALASLTMSETVGAPSREMSRRSARTLTVPASPVPKVVALICSAVAHLQVAGGDLYPPARARCRSSRVRCWLIMPVSTGRAVAGDEQAVGRHAHRAGVADPEVLR